MSNSEVLTQNNLLKQFLKVRKRTLELCAPLKTEDFIPQPALFASPTKWHLAHTTWFFEEMILKHHCPDYQIFHSDFGFLFNSYYNSIGARTERIDRGSITRPGVDEVFAYREYVDGEMEAFLGTEFSSEVRSLLELGLQHEQQHQELLMTDLKFTLSRNPLHPVYKENWQWLKEENIGNHQWLKIEEGIYHIGHNGVGFSFDNEHNRHRVFLEPFEISNHLVTNAEFLEFIEAGGYTNFNYWLDEGWAWVQENKVEHPLYWIKVTEVGINMPFQAS